MLGISHKTAPIEVREKLVIDAERLPSALRELNAGGEVSESLILSTCNRTELYCCTESANNSQPIEWLGRQGALATGAITPFLYQHRDDLAVRHLLRVACGLDSMVLGEPQILGQLKEAYRAANAAGTTGKLFERLLQFSFHVAKEVRTTTAIGANPVSVAYTAVRLAVQIHGDLSTKTALLIGAGDTMRLVATHLFERQVEQLIIANRSLPRAEELAARFEARAIGLTELPNILPHADIVVSSTASRLPIITRNGIMAAMRTRRHQPIFIADLAVPRDVEPAVGEVEDVFLYDIDHLQSVVDDNIEARQISAAKADELVNIYVQEYMDWLQSLSAVNTIRDLRAQAARHREDVMRQAARRLDAGEDPVKVMAHATHSLMNRLIHGPTARLREADASANVLLLENARRLWGLDPDPEESATKDDDSSAVHP